MRVGDGGNFQRSSRHGIWGIQSSTPFGKHFICNVRPGDRMWFVQSASHGKLIAVATYRSHNERVTGPLVATTKTDEELGWIGTGWTSDIEIHYTDLYDLSKCELLSHIKGSSTIRRYNEKCRINLPVEYSYIVRYSKAIRVEL